MRRRLRKAGLGLEPFLVVREDNFDKLPSSVATRFTFRFMHDDEIDSLIGFGPSVTRRKMQTWLDGGRRCFAAWEGSRLVAKMWCDFREFNFKPHYRLLEEEEVYFFAAYSDPDFRGQGLAPALRLQCYAALKSLGHSRFYSVTDYFNPSARRFKEKLGAKNELLGLHICLFGKWSRTITLHRYP